MAKCHKEPHTDCYYNFGLLITDHGSEDSITLLGYWLHLDGEEGVDEIADFLCSEYSNYGAVRMKAEMVVKALNESLNK